jgi:hypothetical protein
MPRYKCVPLAGLLLGGLAIAQPADPQLEALKRAQFCSRAAAEFMSKPEWQPQNRVADQQSHTSHYNERMKRCLVQVRRVQLADKTKTLLEMHHVYDALSGQALGGKILTKNADPMDATILKVLLVRDGKFARDASEATTMLEWFDRLMVE